MNSLFLNEFGLNGKEFRFCTSFAVSHYVFTAASICFSIIAIYIQTMYAGSKVSEAVLGIAIMLLMWCLYKAACAITEESVLVLKGVGIQVITKSTCSSISYFIDMSRIHDVVINEGVIGPDIFCYLAILLKDDSRLAFSGIHPLFLLTRPCLRDLKRIREEMQAVIKS